MDSLAGELTTMEIDEVLALIGTKRLTGQLLLEDGVRRKSFFIKEGEVVQCSSNQEHESFGQLLRQLDRVTSEQLERAMDAKHGARTLLGVQLVQLGYMTEDEVRQTLLVRMRETLLDILQWPEGTFRFLRDLEPSDLPSLNVSLDVASLGPEIEFRKTAWETMRHIFETERVTFIVNEERLPCAPVPDSLDDRLFERMRAGKTLAEISAELFSSPFFLYQKLYALYRNGVIALGPTREPETPLLVGESMDDTAQMLSLARGFIQSGNFEQAELVAARAIEISPTPEAHQVLAQAEAAHFAELRRRLLEPNPAPRLSDGLASFKNLSLSPHEKYLLSRIDGTRTVRSLLRISPMREFDALRCIAHFADTGYIELPGEKTPSEGA